MDKINKDNATSNKFSNLPISPAILSAIVDLGYENPTTIQELAIPAIAEGQDIIGISQTGSGKTAAFLIPVLDKLTPWARHVEILLVANTRELVLQISNEIKKFSRYKKGIQSVAIFGGQNIEKQIFLLKRGVNIVVGTPGRLIDLIKRGDLNLSYVKMVVLDEADEMLNLGFREDIYSIMSHIGSKHQTALFSATMSEEIMKITKQFQHDPKVIKIEKKTLTATTIEQYYFYIPPYTSKLEVLYNAIVLYKPTCCLVFCNTKNGVDELTKSLQKSGLCVESIHGDMKQFERTRIINNFKAGITPILIATDVVARGIDANMDMVFNFDLPQNIEYYVHRIGRTGRAGRAGKSIAFVTGRQQNMLLRDIEQYTKSRIKQMELPDASLVIELKRDNIKNSVKNVISTSKLDKYSKIINELISEGHEAQSIASALLKLGFSDCVPRDPVKIAPRQYVNHRNSRFDQRFSKRYAEN